MLMARVRADFRETARALAQFQADARNALLRQGGFIRTTAKNSIRSAAKPSQPGHPPRSVTGLLKQFIFFKWDDASQSVVAGPAAFKANAVVPEVLEKGGKELARVKVGRDWKNQTVTIAPRPFMAPAFQISQTKLPEYWQKSVS